MAGAPAAAAAARAMVSASTEVAVARYVFITSATPAARGGLIEAVAASLLAARGGVVDAVAASLSAARGDGWVPVPLRPCACGPHAYSVVVAAQPDGGDGGGYFNHGSRPRVAIPPPRSAYPRPHAYSVVVAAQPDGGDGGGDLSHGSGSRVAIPPPPSVLLLTARVSGSRVEQICSRGLSILPVRASVISLPFEARQEEDDDETRAASFVRMASLVSTTALPRAYSFVSVAARPDEGDGGGCMEAATPPSLYVVPGSTTRFFNVAAGARTPRIPPHIPLAASGPGPFGLGRKRMFGPPSILPIGRRHCSDWAWTPWSPNRPKDAKAKAKELDDVIKFLMELEASPEAEKKLKEAFFDKFYAGKDDDPKTVDLKLDLLLHKVDETKRLAQDIKGQKIWGTFRFFGKKLDLSSLSSIGTAIAQAIGGMF